MEWSFKLFHRLSSERERRWRYSSLPLLLLCSYFVSVRSCIFKLCVHGDEYLAFVLVCVLSKFYIGCMYLD